MMPRCDIEELRRENAKLKEMVSYTPEEWNTMLRTVERNKEDIQLLIKKLLSVKPELENWLKKNFGEYL
jgi:hypothetical protein